MRKGGACVETQGRTRVVLCKGMGGLCRGMRGWAAFLALGLLLSALTGCSSGQTATESQGASAVSLQEADTGEGAEESLSPKEVEEAKEGGGASRGDSGESGNADGGEEGKGRVASSSGEAGMREGTGEEDADSDGAALKDDAKEDASGEEGTDDAGVSGDAEDPTDGEAEEKEVSVLKDNNQYNGSELLEENEDYRGGYFRSYRSRDGLTIITNCCFATTRRAEESADEYIARIGRELSGGRVFDLFLEYSESYSARFSSANFSTTAYQVSFLSGAEAAEDGESESGQDEMAKEAWEMLFFATDAYTYVYAYATELDTGEEEAEEAESEGDERGESDADTGRNGSIRNGTGRNASGMSESEREKESEKESERESERESIAEREREQLIQAKHDAFTRDLRNLYLSR